MLGTILLIVAGVLLVGIFILWLWGERWHLMRPSSWQFLKLAGLKRFIDLRSIHVYIYARWIEKYIDVLVNFIFPRLGPQGKKYWSDHYHGKVLTHDQAEALVLIDQDIPLQDLDQIIPYPIARDLVLSAPPDIVVFPCGCR